MSTGVNDFDLHSDRDSISGSVQLLLDEATEPWGIKVFYSAIIVITTITISSSLGGKIRDQRCSAPCPASGDVSSWKLFEIFVWIWRQNELGQMYLFSLPFICHQLIIFWGIIGLPVVWQVNSSKRFEILVLFPCLNVDKMIFQCFQLFEIKIIFVQCAHYWKYNNNLWQQYSNNHEDQYCLNSFTIGVTIFQTHFMNNVDTNIYALFASSCK